MTRGRRLVALVCLAVCLTGAVTFAQRGGFGRNRRQSLDLQVEGNTPYDGRFVFVRLKYGSGFGGGRQGPPWSHDYPDGEIHFSKILEELTLLDIRTNGSNILGLDDPELFNYPVAYMAEPGFWEPSESEAESFRKYLQKGGFAIFDDFRGNHWDNLQYQMQRVLPEARWVELDGSALVFHSFFEIPHPLELMPPYGGLPPSYWGIFENNDPKRRLVAIANVNQDLSEYWEFEPNGPVMIDLTNEAYKFGVNYVMYGLTH